jgi:hypothetical protein
VTLSREKEEDDDDDDGLILELSIRQPAWYPNFDGNADVNYEQEH